MTYRYHLYGLTAASELELPELLPAASGSIADISFRLGTVPKAGLTDAKQTGPFAYASNGTAWLSVPEVARYLIIDGREIVIDPAPGIDEGSVRVFLLGSCLGALLFQRGKLLLHGNAIRIGDGCLICAGRSGIGKSTLAAAFRQQDYPLLADDVVAIDETCNAIPGFPRIKLWQDSADKLNIDTSGLRRIRPGLEKFDLPLGRAFHADPLPVKWIYILQTHEKQEFALEAINGLDRFLPLRANTYRMRLVQGMELEASHLKLCGNLAGRIRLAYIYRPKSGFDLNKLVEFIKADVAEHP